MSTTEQMQAMSSTYNAQARMDDHLQLPLTALDKAFAQYLQASLPSNDSRHELLAAMASYQFGRGHVCLDMALLKQEGVRVLGWDQRVISILPANLSQAADTLLWTKGPQSPLVLDGQRLYLRRNWSAEQSIRAAIEARLSQSCAVPENLAETLDLLFPTSVEDTRSTNPTSNWQKVACALAARQRFTLITGGPGTGKTFTVARLLALLQFDATRQGKPLRIELAAPTGKAAARLGESIASAVKGLPEAMRHNIPVKASTLHKLLQILPNQATETAPELAVDLVVVDEASMIDLEMMARLLAEVPLTASVILLGDKDQLASVEAGAVMGQLCEDAILGKYTSQTIDWVKKNTNTDLSAWAGQGSALAQQTVMLRDSRRFSDDSIIGLWAKAVNAGDVSSAQNLWNEAPECLADAAILVDRLVPTHPNDSRLAAQIKQGWQEWLSKIQHLDKTPCSDQQALAILEAFAKFQVLCAVREGSWGVNALNLHIASMLGFETDGWYAGRPVMVTRNDYNLNLMNGDIGLCLPHVNGLRVAFPNGQGGIHRVSPSRLDSVENVFAMTVHKSQGSEFDHVCLILPEQAVAVLTRELLYTGITRAKTRLTLVVPQVEVLWRSVEMKVLRSGGLGGGV